MAAASLRWLPLGLAGLIPFGLLLSGCRPQTDRAFRDADDLLMVDCRFENNGLVHLHIDEARGQATLVSDYSPGSTENHSQDLRSGRETEGRLVKSAEGEQRIELFLLNDHFGEKPGEQLFLHMAADGRSRFEARGPGGGSERIVDFGTCSRKGDSHSHHNGTAAP